MTNKKRTSAQATGEDGQEKPIKRRASTACQACRARKVRCNVLENGPPCTNCRLDDVQCTISIGKRRLGMSRGNAEAILLFSDHGPSDSVEGTYFSGYHKHNNHGHNHNHNHNHNHVHAHKNTMNKSPQHMPQLMHRSTFPGFTGATNVNVDAFPETQYQFMETAFGRSTHNVSPPLSHGSAEAPPGLSLGMNELRSSPASFLAPQALPSWIKSLPERISGDDIEFLTRKGALSVHDQTFRNELLKCFVRWVYPWSPVVSLDHVVGTISGGNGGSGKISLLLFQAMMFAGAGFADIAILRSAGFTSRKDARKHFFNRCKLLYDFEYEDDRLVLIQALVLMTYWHDSADDQKDIWHWITVAVALAQTIGLNQDPDTLEMTATEKHLRKRVWWSLFMRDRLVALAMRRAAKIQLHEAHVPPLTVADFDVYEGSSTYPDFLKMDPTSRERIAMVSVESCKLCTIVGRILDTQYSTACIRRRGSGSQERPNTTTTMVLVPRKANDDKIQVLALDGALSVWIEELPPAISYENVRRQGHQNDNFEMRLHCAQLAMLYHTAQIMLFRPAHLSHSSAGTRLESKQESKSALDKTREAGLQITRISTELESTNSVRYLLTVGVTIVVHAAMVQLIEAGAPDPTHRQQSIENLAKSMRVLEQLCDVYIAADLAVQLLQTGISQAGIRLTSQHRTSISPLSIIDEEPRHDKHVHQAIMQDKAASDMSIGEDPVLVSATDEFAPNIWPGLTPSGQTPGVENIFGYHDTAFTLDEDMAEFSSFGYNNVSGGKDGFFPDSDLLEPHLTWITT